MGWRRSVFRWPALLYLTVILLTKKVMEKKERKKKISKINRGREQTQDAGTADASGDNCYKMKLLEITVNENEQNKNSKEYCYLTMLPWKCGTIKWFYWFIVPCVLPALPLPLPLELCPEISWAHCGAGGITTRFRALVMSLLLSPSHRELVYLLPK